MRVYGPYKRKDGRSHVIVYYDDGDHPTTGSRRTVSYPKFLVEQHLGRKLDPDAETVDHIDGDFTNNDLSNLRIIPRSQHASEDARRANDVEVVCVWCGKSFVVPGRRVGHRHLKKAGPFCTKSCSGKYGAAIQNGRIAPIPPVKVERSYSKMEKKVDDTVG